MPLFKKGTSFQIDETKIAKRSVVPMTKITSTMSSWSGNSIMQDCIVLCNKSISSRTKPKNSFLVFGMVFGEHAEDQEAADAIWNDLWILYNGKDDEKGVFDFLRKLLGSILMIQIAKNNGIWEFEQDPDKALKLSAEEKPDAAIYNLRKKK